MQIKGLFGLILFFISLVVLQAQDCEMYYPVEEGTEMEVKNYDHKDKLTGSTIQKITNKEVSGSNVKLTIENQTFDKKGEKLMEGNFDVRCEDGIFYMDMRNMIPEDALSAYQEMEIEVDANDMAFPSNLVVGSSLPDADITIKVNSGGMTVFKMTVKIINRKVDGQEEITTPAGTFSTYKISYDMDTKMVIRVQGKVVQWIAKDIGVVRSESFNKKGKLQGYSVLTALK